MGKKSKLTALLTGTAVLATGLTPASSQESAPGGLALSFGVSSSLRSNDNLGLREVSPGTTTLWDNRLTFGALSETPNARLSFDIGATVRTAWVPGRSATTDIDDPSAVLSYRLESANSLVEAEASYRKISLNFSDPLRLIDDDPDDDIDEQDLISSGGARVLYGGRVSFESGRVDPLGYGLSFEHRRTDYQDVTDGALYDSETNGAEAFVRLQFSPVLESRLTAFWEQYDADNPEQRSRRTIGASGSLTYEIDAITIATLNLGYRKIEENTTTSSTTSIDGITGSFRLSRDFPTGNVSAGITSALATSGRRNTLDVTSRFERPNGEFIIGVGVTKGETDVVNWVGNLGITHELPRGIITASIDRSVRGTDEGVENLSTRASLDYAMDLTRTSSLSIGLDYAEISEIGSADTTAVSGVNATYTRALTPDWDISTGYEYRHRSETGEIDRESNEFFLTLSREFSVR